MTTSKGKRLVAATTALLVLAVTMIMSPVVANHETWLDLVAGELRVNENVEMRIELAGAAADGIPDGYGYAALTSDGSGVLAVTTHGGILDSEEQEDASDPVFHTHEVDLEVSNNCNSGLKVKSVSIEAPGDLEVSVTIVSVTDASSDSLGDFTGLIVSFTLTEENGAICVNPDELIDVGVIVGGDDDNNDDDNNDDDNNDDDNNDDDNNDNNDNDNDDEDE